MSAPLPAIGFNPWNRMIFYDGRLFHSGGVGGARALTGDPATGRLTLNGFFTCSRPAG